MNAIEKKASASLRRRGCAHLARLTHPLSELAQGHLLLISIEDPSYRTLPNFFASDEYGTQDDKITP